MMDRRRLLMSVAAGGALAAVGPVRALAHAAVAQTASADFNALMNRIAQEMLLTDPESLTMLGMDRGEHADARFKLSDRSQAKVEADKVKFVAAMKDMAAIDRNALPAKEQIYHDSLTFFGETVMEGYAFPYGGGMYPSPYTVSQLGGSYQQIPDFLDSQHRIEAADDAEAYLSRLSDFARSLDDERERMRIDYAAGAVPPDFVIDRTLTQMGAITGTAVADSVMSQSIARRTAEKNIPGDWAARAQAILTREVYPAIQRQADALKAVRAGATHDGGVWRLPDGEAYYRYGLKNYTTSSMTPDEVHQMGLDQVAEISARADGLLKAQGLTQGTVGQRIAALGKDPRFVYPNTDEAKEELLKELNVQMAAMQARMPDYFGRLPKSPCDIRRVPKAIEAGAPGGYYMTPALDGSRPGAYYINLRDTAEWPKWTLPTLTYHEAVPGHHFQIALQMEQPDTPLLMKVMGFSAYSEGWGLYSEQLADEIGAYENDPFGQIGYLQSLMFRAARLVVDSGLHHKRWSREQGIRYMVDTLGDQESSIATEVERYCVWPGQASSYKVGHTTWVRLREDAKKRLGSRFDIKGFHDTGLNLGGVPLTVLERTMNAWTPA
ncbi:MAG: Tat pathway signal protein [Brevundimonas diminuta]|nr:MAG: Tat pathway signal protein [Brevundimonas diminuta]